VTSPSCIEIFPNPFTDKITLDGDFTDFTIQVFNETGQMITDYTGTSSPLSIDLNGLGSGIYFISVAHKTMANLKVYKIIKP